MSSPHADFFPLSNSFNLLGSDLCILDIPPKMHFKERFIFVLSSLMLLKDFHIGEPVKLKAIVLYSVLGPTEERDSHPSQSPWIPYLPEGPVFFRGCQQKIVLLLAMIHSRHTVSSQCMGPTVNLGAGDHLDNDCFQICF